MAVRQLQDPQRGAVEPAATQQRLGAHEGVEQGEQPPEDDRPQALLERVARGPRISGHVRDETGAPLSATVTIDAIEQRAGERWSSRPRDGRFDRLLVEPGKYAVRAEAPGRAPVTREVRVSTRPVEVELVLAPKS